VVHHISFLWYNRPAVPSFVAFDTNSKVRSSPSDNAPTRKPQSSLPSPQFCLQAVHSLRALLVASRGHFSGISVVYQAVECQSISCVPRSVFSCNSCVPRCWSEDGTSENCSSDT
jgi:hypothetical protein